MHGTKISMVKRTSISRDKLEQRKIFHATTFRFISFVLLFLMFVFLNVCFFEVHIQYSMIIKLLEIYIPFSLFIIAPYNSCLASYTKLVHEARHEL